MGCGTSSDTAALPPASSPPPVTEQPAAETKPSTNDESSNEFLASYDEFKVIEAFAKYDLDKNGSIDAKELGVVLRNLGRNPTDEELDAYIKDADKDGSGVIEFKEFLPMCIKLKLL